MARGTHSVYVAELDSSVAEKRRVMERNPRRQEGKSTLYVGLTGHTPEERFAQHKDGYKASRHVRDHGQKLRPDLYAHLNPMSYGEAQRKEAQLAAELRRRGHTVVGGGQARKGRRE